MEKKTAFKDLSIKQKIGYIWDYYKIPIAVTLVIIATITYYFHGVLTKKNNILGVLCVNSLNDENLSETGQYDDFLVENGFDPSKDAILHNSTVTVNVSSALSYQQSSVLDAYFSSEEFDIFFADEETFEYYIDNCAFVCISDYLDKNTLEKYKDNFVYVTDPDTNEKYACGIKIDQKSCKWLEESGLYDECVVGICFNDNDSSLITAFLNYILNY